VGPSGIQLTCVVVSVQVFADMEEEGVEPDTQTFNTLLCACHAAGDYYKALRMRQRMRALDVQPDDFTFSILINGCAKSSPPKVRASALFTVRA
jgi:pentatricopeptide repeat protein